jgi:hypothetical protein
MTDLQNCQSILPLTSIIRHMLNYHQKMITPYRLSLALHSNVNIFNRNTKNIPISKNRIGGVMVSMLTSSAFLLYLMYIAVINSTDICILQLETV